MKEGLLFSENICKSHTPSVKLRAGASIVKRKPLFSFDSKYILVPSGCDVKVFSIASGVCTLTFKEHKQPVVSIQINKNNSLQVLSCSEDGIVIRWDYADGKSLMQYELGMNTTVSAFFPVTINDWFVTSKYEDDYRLYDVKVHSRTVNFKTMLLKSIKPHENCIAIGPEGSYVAGIQNNILLVKNVKTGFWRRHITAKKELLCVAAHPTEMMLATGDNLGCILVWTNIFDTRPTRSIHHWHSLPLADLVFSSEGSHIYSGGGECVLVNWNLNSETKGILPRLGLPICLLAVSPDNSYVATSHIDNGIQIISSQNKVIQLIQGLTQGHCGGIKRQEILPTGMLYDSRSNAIVMNGRPGHLQFYNIYDDHQLFNLDIVGQNYISQERDIVVFNTDIERAAVDCQGLWLATVECRDDGETSPEIRLKFWKFDLSSQKFELNTNVFLPHHKKINSLRFRPKVNDEEESEYSPLAVTTSNDGRFKIWSLGETKTSGKLNWSCELMGYYKELPASDACFSEDGSLLAVAFNHVATLWSPEANVLKATLYKSESTDLIKHMLFGRGKSSHLLVSHTERKLTVWDVSTLSAVWNVNCEVQFLVDDPMSEVMASFSKDHHLYIFKPSDPKPIAVLNDITSSPVVAAVFVPHQGSCSLQENSISCCWQQYTKLYFLNQNQEMLTVTDDGSSTIGENDFEKVKLHQNLPITPFGLLQAQHVSSHVKPSKSERHIFYEFHKGENTEVSDLPCPSNVNPVALCAALLSSLLNPRVMAEEKEDCFKVKDDTSDSECTDDESPITNILTTEKETIESTSEEPMDINDQILPQINDFKYLLDYVNL